jgi:hypothetical protein
MSSAAEPIDAVYLWVDGSQPAFQRELKRHIPSMNPDIQGTAADPERFRDSGELRHSLRSLAVFAPWIRKIHVVTNGQVPDWLDTGHGRIALVTHDRIFRDRSCLPTFNSHAIELQLHRIPDLTRRFLYINDDCFFGRDVRPEDYILPGGGQHLYFEPNPITDRFAGGPLHDRAYLHTVRILDQRWPKNPAYFSSGAYYRRIRDRLLGRRPSWRMLPAHMPQLYDREILTRLEDLFAEEVQLTGRRRFRSARDIVPRLAYFYYLLESGKYGRELAVHALPWVSEAYVLVMLRPAVSVPDDPFSDIRRLHPQFFCINDDLGEAGPDHPALESLRSFLAEFFPTPSPFEKIGAFSPAPNRSLLAENTSGPKPERPTGGNS